MASLSRQLAQWVVGLRYEDLPPAVVDRAKGVTLHGLVASEEQRDGAETVARKVDGARQVRNLLQVVPPGERARLAASAAALAERVEAALDAAPELSDAAIEIASVHDGVVLLEGEARSLGDARSALELAASRDGVRRVASQIRTPDRLGDASAWHAGPVNARPMRASRAATAGSRGW